MASNLTLKVKEILKLKVHSQEAEDAKLLASDIWRLGFFLKDNIPTDDLVTILTKLIDDINENDVLGVKQDIVDGEKILLGYYLAPLELPGLYVNKLIERKEKYFNTRLIKIFEEVVNQKYFISCNTSK